MQAHTFLLCLNLYDRDRTQGASGANKDIV